MVKLVKSSLMGGRGNIFSKLQTFLSQAKNGRHRAQKILNIMTRHFFFYISRAWQQSLFTFIVWEKKTAWTFC